MLHLQHTYVVMTTLEVVMSDALTAILNRRAIKVFDPIEITPILREQILHAARCAPSSFNIQPYRFFWIESPAAKPYAAKLCFSQRPAETASALIVAVADIGSWKATTEGQLQWMRQGGINPQKLPEYEKRAKYAKWFFIQGWFNIFGGLKWAILRLVHLWRIIGMAPVSRKDLFKWATKNASLACQNLMIAAEALGLNTCPMEGFDGRRLSKLLGLSARYHEIIMVIAIGKKSSRHEDQRQWRRPIEQTVAVL
jgi:nitroreductase